MVLDQLELLDPFIDFNKQRMSQRNLNNHKDTQLII